MAKVILRTPESTPIPCYVGDYRVQTHYGELIGIEFWRTNGSGFHAIYTNFYTYEVFIWGDIATLAQLRLLIPESEVI